MTIINLMIIRGIIIIIKLIIKLIQLQLEITYRRRSPAVVHKDF